MSDFVQAMKAGGAILCAVTVSCLGSPAAFSQQRQSDGSPFSFEVAGGIEYNSNISVIELDRATSSDDFAVTIDGQAEFETDITDTTEVTLSYNFSQSLHFDITDFDIQTHRGTVSLNQELGPIDAGLSYFFAHSTLGGDGFLDLQRITPSISGFLGQRLFLRAAYDFTDKNFKNRIDRDSDVNAFGLTAFFFLDGTRTFVTAGYRLELEDAVDPRFDFDGHNLRLRLSHDFRFVGKLLEFDIGWRYEKRDYDSITPSIGEIRDDERNRFEASLEVPFGEQFYSRFEYEYKDFSSNLPAADFTENVALFEVGARF